MGRTIQTQAASEQPNPTVLKRRRDTELVVQRIKRLPVVGPMLTDADFYDDDGLPSEQD